MYEALIELRESDLYRIGRLEVFIKSSRTLGDLCEKKE